MSSLDHYTSNNRVRPFSLVVHFQMLRVHHVLFYVPRRLALGLVFPFVELRIFDSPSLIEYGYNMGKFCHVLFVASVRLGNWGKLDNPYMVNIA